MALVCDKCGATIPEGARFCPRCADPVTAADTVNGRVAVRERVNLICPRCRTANLQTVGADGAALLKCGHCGGDFATRVIQVRAKSSRGSRKTDTRDFTVRALDLAGRDQLFEFTARDNADFELRSRDLAAFTYQNGRLALVQNLTLGRTLMLGQPGSGCSGAGAGVLGLVALLFLGFCALVTSGGNSGSSAGAPAPSYSDASPGPSYPTPAYDVLYIHGALSLRSAPNRNAAVVRTLVRGEQVRLGPADARGWAPAYDVNGRQEGYVYRASDLVRAAPPAERSEPRSSGSAGTRTGSRRGSASSRGYYLGPRGGCYTYSASGRKRYVDHSYCY
jgi:hypothetical protein